MFFSSITYHILLPSEPLGFLLLILGFSFTSMIIWIFINVSKDIDSLSDKRRKELKKQQQLYNISRLYPKKLN